MRNTALTLLGALLVTCSTAQLSMASEHQAHKARNYRGAYNQLNDPAYEASGTSYSWNTSSSSDQHNAALSEPERVILRRLGIFAGAFRLEAASAVLRGIGQASLIRHAQRLMNVSAAKQKLNDVKQRGLDGHTIRLHRFG